MISFAYASGWNDPGSVNHACKGDTMKLSDQIQEHYDQLLQRSRTLGVPHYAVDMSEMFAKSWHGYFHALKRFRGDFDGRVVLDFGCKFGHVIPQFLAMGVGKSVGVDANPEYG